jgi:hypothetical protein
MNGKANFLGIVKNGRFHILLPADRVDQPPTFNEGRDDGRPAAVFVK